MTPLRPLLCKRNSVRQGLLGGFSAIVARCKEMELGNAMPCSTMRGSKFDELPLGEARSIRDGHVSDPEIP